MTLFRLPCEAELFAPEIYLEELPGSRGEFSLHPEGYQSSLVLRLKGWPDVESWKKIFTFFPWQDALAFARYLEKLVSQKEVNVSNAMLDSLLKAMGSSVARLEEWLFLAGATESIANLHTVKGIPLKMLRLLHGPESLLERISGQLCQDAIKSNIAREIFSLWIDLDEASALSAVEKLEELQKEASTENKIDTSHYSHRARELMLDMRYPVYRAKQRELDTLSASVEREHSIKITYAPQLEKVELMMCKKVRSAEELKVLSTELDSGLLQEKIEKILQVMRQL